MAYFRKVPAKNKQGYTWSFTINLPNDPLTGKRRQITRRGFATKKDAEKMAVKLQNEIDQGIYVDPKGMTVAQYMEQWLETKKHQLRDTTFSQYQVKVTKWIIPLLGNVKLDKLSAAHGQKFVNELLKEQSSSTARKAFSILKAAINDAVKLEIIYKNPFEYVAKPKENKNKINTWSFEELRTFLNTAKNENDKYFNLYFVAANTGMRKGELLGLRKRDIDFENKCINIVQSISEVKDKVYIGELKTKSSKRQIFIDDAVCQILKNQIKRQNEQKLLMGERYKDNDLIFSYDDGSPIRPTTINRHFRKMIEKAGVPKIRFHDLRHTHATLLLKLGVNPKIVSERLGHASVKITLDTYSHVTSDLQEKVAHMFGNALNFQ